MESAASLFGPGDASSDPFASLGGQDNSTEALQTDHNAHNAGITTDVDANGSSFFDQDVSQDNFYNSEQAVHTTEQPTYSYGTASNQAPVYQTQYDGMPGQQNYQPTYANGHGYQAETPKYSPPVATAPPANPYEPSQTPSNTYAPPTNSYQPTSYGQQYAPQTSYDGMPNQNNAQTYQPSSYNTYTPNGGSNSQYGYGTPTYAPTHSAQQTPPIPPPTSSFAVPPPNTSTVKPVSRPKVANAYDPPIPAARQNRRQTPRVSSAPAPYGYNSYDTQRTPPVGPPVPSATPPISMNGYQSSLPPPPPRPPQSTFGQTPSQSLPPPPPRAPAAPAHAEHPSSYGAHGRPVVSPPPAWNQGERGSHESSPYESAAPQSHGQTNGIDNTASHAPSAPENFFDQIAPESQQDVPWEPAKETETMHQSKAWSPHSSTKSEHAEVAPHTSHSQVDQYAADPESIEADAPLTSANIQAEHSQPSPNDTRATSPPAPPPARYSPEVQHNVYAPPRTMSPLSGPPVAPPRTMSPSSGPPVSRPPVDPYAPRTMSPLRESQPPLDPYAPTVPSHLPHVPRTSSPLATNRPNGAVHSSYDKPFTSPPKADRNRSMSGASLLSNHSMSAEDPYAPPRRSQTLSSSGSFGQYGGVSPVQHRGGTPDLPAPQEVTLKPAFQSHYAPSPSLHGANDPLGRSTARIPVFSFGFGGKIVTCFHGANTVNTGFDVALSSRNTTGIRIRNLKTVIPEVQQDTSSTFPGPLFGDPGSQTTSLVRTGPNSHMKNKKSQVVKYLSDRATELELGLRYLESDTLAYGRANGKLILTKLLKVMVEHDGRLTGSPEIDMAVRTVLVPALENAAEPSTFVTPSDASSAFGYPTVPGQVDAAGQEIAITTLKPSHLEKIEEFLMRGERKKAYHYALDEKLWAHAMVIASSIDKDAWKEVVGEFLKGELASKPSGSSGGVVQGRESLRVVYSLFSGQGPSAIQEFNPQNLLLRATAPNQLQPPLPVASQITPKTPNFAAPVQPPPTPASLAKWPETVAMMLSTPLPADTAAALTALGDQLMAAQLYEAAHVCYMLSPQTSPLGGLGQPAARLTLVGSKSPQAWSMFAKDPDPFVLSEVLEFALALAPTTKGQEPFAGIAHLQAYRFIRAMSLFDLGDVQQANRYCEAITASLSRASPYTTTTLLEQLKELSDRIAGNTQVDKSFWSGGKLAKPSLDTIGGWLEGRFTKLVTGDEEKTPEEEKKNEGRDFSGPFSHYSTISSNTPSARSSPQPTHINPHTLPPPARSGSAMAHASPYAYQPIDRASSAMDHVRRKSTPQPLPKAVPASSTATSFYNTPSSGSLQSQENLVTPRPPLAGEGESQESGAWWSQTGYDEGLAGKTPTTATFMKVDHGLADNQSNDGFISLMDNHSYSVGSSRPTSGASHHSPVSRTSYEEDDDDLGLGNSKPKPKKTDTSDTIKPAEKEAPKPAATRPAEKKPEPQQSGSWFSRWWNKSDGPGPVKANLGEQSSFYYDKDLKRWVNKNASAEEEQPAAPPPPPSRAQTASPGMTGHPPPPSPGGTPPPARAASAIDLSTSPPSRTVMRVRSNLVPPGAPESAPSTPTGSRLAPTGPPPGRPRSQASKRNVRNRYVDVFSQENAGNGA